MKKLLAIVVTVTLLATALGVGSIALAAEDDPATPNLDESLITGSTTYTYTDSGWPETYSGTTDCAPDYEGWGDDDWELTLTDTYILKVTVEDCCIAGDYYEIYVDGNLIGTTPEVTPYGPTLSEGSALVILEPGVHLVEIRDAVFDTNPELCPAGYWVTGEVFGPITPIKTDTFTWTAPNADPPGGTGEVEIVEYMLNETDTELFYDAMGQTVTGQEAFIYQVTNLSWTPITGVNGFSGFNIVNQFDVDTVGNAFGPPGWEAFAGYSGVNTPPNPDNFEWDIRDDVGNGLLVGETGLFGFTVAAGQYGDGHYGPGSWMHSWSGGPGGQVDIIYQADISGPVPFWVYKWLEDAWEVSGNGDEILDIGEEWHFKIGITVSNDLPVEITNVMIKDNFGGDLRVVSVDLMGDMIDPTFVPDPSSQNGKKPTWSDLTTGVSIQWTGKTYKAHLSWNVGSLPPNFIPPPQSATLFIVVATDMNTGKNKNFPDGHQEYTSEGEHCLNSGATATGLIDDEWAVIDKSDEICVETGQEPPIPND